VAVAAYALRTRVGTREWRSTGTLLTKPLACMFAQGVTDHYQVLLDQGAAVPGSPAEARLARLIHDSGEVLTLPRPAPRLRCRSG